MTAGGSGRLHQPKGPDLAEPRAPKSRPCPPHGSMAQSLLLLVALPLPDHKASPMLVAASTRLRALTGGLHMQTASHLPGLVKRLQKAGPHLPASENAPLAGMPAGMERAPCMMPSAAGRSLRSPARRMESLELGHRRHHRAEGMNMARLPGPALLRAGLIPSQHPLGQKEGQLMTERGRSGQQILPGSLQQGQVMTERGRPGRQLLLSSP